MSWDVPGVLIFQLFKTKAGLSCFTLSVIKYILNWKAEKKAPTVYFFFSIKSIFSDELKYFNIHFYISILFTKVLKHKLEVLVLYLIIYFFLAIFIFLLHFGGTFYSATCERRSLSLSVLFDIDVIDWHNRQKDNLKIIKTTSGSSAVPQTGRLGSVSCTSPYYISPRSASAINSNCVTCWSESCVDLYLVYFPVKVSPVSEHDSWYLNHSVL